VIKACKLICVYYNTVYDCGKLMSYPENSWGDRSCLKCYKSHCGDSVFIKCIIALSVCLCVCVCVCVRVCLCVTWSSSRKILRFWQIAPINWLVDDAGFVFRCMSINRAGPAYIRSGSNNRSVNNHGVGLIASGVTTTSRENARFIIFFVKKLLII